MSDVNRTPADVTQTAHADLIAQARTTAEWGHLYSADPDLLNRLADALKSTAAERDRYKLLHEAAQEQFRSSSARPTEYRERAADLASKNARLHAELRQERERNTRNGKDIDWWVEAMRSARESVVRVTVSYLRARNGELEAANLQARIDATRPALDATIDLWDGHISTHYDGCWTRHAACLARLIRTHLDDEGTHE